MLRQLEQTAPLALQAGYWLRRALPSWARCTPVVLLALTAGCQRTPAPAETAVDKPKSEGDGVGRKAPAKDQGSPLNKSPVDEDVPPDQASPLEAEAFRLFQQGQPAAATRKLQE